MTAEHAHVEQRHGRGAGGNFVIGHSAVLIREQVRDSLTDFRLNRVPVDLRIERSMLSAAIELVLDSDEMSTSLVREAKSQVLCDSGRRGKHVPGYTPVLVKDETKQRLRYFGVKYGVSDDLFQMERILASLAVEAVIKAQELWDRWVDLTASHVGKEVLRAYGFSRQA